MNALIVVAHPDDEALGCGATAAALAHSGVGVRTCILSGRASARRQRPSDPDLLADTLRAHEALGLEHPIMGDFPNIMFNTVPHLELVQFVEAAMAETRAQVIFTHHPADLNDDHGHTSRACQAAARLFQRRADFPPLRALYFMEVLSSTDWSFAAGAGGFAPDAFFEIGEDWLARKLKSLAAYRGGQAGVRYAEAFQTAFRSLAAGDFV